MTLRTPRELDEVIADYLAEADSGRTPDPADWIARHAEHAAQLAAFFADIGRFGDFIGLHRVPNPDLTTDYSLPDTRLQPRTDDRRFAEYELLGNPIGEGGMGVVWRARVTGTSLVVALKQLRKTGGDATGRFLEEIETAAGLRHPNIVPVYHVGELAGKPFFTMGLMGGGSLDRRLGQFQEDPRAACGLVAKVARAVHHAHQRRVLHRDLKPSNILLDEAGEPHVADFGLAARLTETGATVDAGPPAGSLPWMAPEAVRGDVTLTTAVDVWALGVILYELFTGQRPFPGTDANEVRRGILEKTPVPPGEANNRLPPDLAAVCLRCLEKDPDRRYESASAVALELERWLRDEPVRARRAGRGERLARWCRRNPGVAAGMVTFVCLMIAVSVGSIRLANELEDEVIATVCQNNEYDAEQVAGNVSRRFEQLGGRVKLAARDLEGIPANSDAEKQDIVARLRRLVEAPLNAGEARPFVNAFVLDPGGFIRAASDPAMKKHSDGYSGRDYFTAAGRETCHISRVYPSFNDARDKLALSIRFRPRGATEDWVLAATITTDERLDLGVASMSDERHKAILVARKDNSLPRPPDESGKPDGYVILVHPALRPDSLAVSFEPVQPGETRPFAANRNYRDPLAALNPSFAGRWLTGSARVGDTNLVVVVQQKYDDAVSPQRSFIRRFAAWVGGALAVGLLSFVAFRRLRGRGGIDRA